MCEFSCSFSPTLFGAFGAFQSNLFFIFDNHKQKISCQMMKIWNRWSSEISIRLGCGRSARGITIFAGLRRLRNLTPMAPDLVKKLDSEWSIYGNVFCTVFIITRAHAHANAINILIAINIAKRLISIYQSLYIYIYVYVIYIRIRIYIRTWYNIN
jgi:hypothetical protein